MKQTVLILMLVFSVLISCYDGLTGVYDEGMAYSVGDPGPAGGIIAQVNDNYKSDGWLYMEAAPGDESSSGWAVALESCSSKVLNGYGDWELPSLDDLNYIYSNISSELGSTEYWSSTEIDSENAWMLNFTSGEETDSGKTSLRAVRAVRKF